MLFLYSTEQERVQGLAEWAAEGLARGERLVVLDCIGDGRDGAGRGGRLGGDLALLEGLLRARGHDLEQAVRGGQVLSESLLQLGPGGDADSLARAAVDGVAAARLTSPATAALRTLRSQRLLEVEDRLDDLCRRYPLSVLCQYERPPAAGERLLRAAQVHEGGVVDALLTASVIGETLHVRGEVDVTNAHVLRTLVESMTRAAGDVLSVDLSGLSFLSASGCRALLEGTVPFRAAGGLLRLVGARPNVQRVLALVGPGPGVELRRGTGV